MFVGITADSLDPTPDLSTPEERNADVAPNAQAGFVGKCVGGNA